MKRMMAAALVAVCVGAPAVARADEKANPTGTWKWTIEFGGQSREGTCKLKLEDGKLTGTVLGRNGQETPIEDGKYKNGEVSFKVVRERDGQKFTVKYHGKVSGDSLKGQIEFEREGNSQSMDWDAKRAKS